MTNINRDRWLVVNSDEYRSYVRYDDISAFTYSEKDKQIRIFLRGNSCPLTFAFNSTEALEQAYSVIRNNLRPE